MQTLCFPQKHEIIIIPSTSSQIKVCPKPSLKQSEPNNDKNINIREPRQRSGSAPKQIQLDLRSVSTAMDSNPRHNSQKQIQDILTTHNISSVPIHNQAFIKTQNIWKLDKNGNIISNNTQDFTTIKYYFISIATKMNMSILKDSQDAITVKAHQNNSIKCLFLMCLPVDGSDRSVFQLVRQKMFNKANKGIILRLMLNSGNEDKFCSFKKRFYYELWINNVLQLQNYQKIAILCSTHDEIIISTKKDYQKACSEYEIKTLSSSQELENWQTTLMNKLKESQTNIRMKILSNTPCSICSGSCIHYLPYSSLNGIILQRIIFNQIPVFQFYSKLEQESSRGYLQKKKNIFQQFTVQKVFQYLEIDNKALDQIVRDNQINLTQKDGKFSQFTLSSIFKDQTKLIKLPYYEAAIILDKIDIFASPLQNISIISKFNTKLLSTYIQYTGKDQPVIDMDSQLPLTIYCILLTKNLQIKPILSFLKDYFETEDFQCENRTLAALKAAYDFVRLQWEM